MFESCATPDELKSEKLKVDPKAPLFGWLMARPEKVAWNASVVPNRKSWVISFRKLVLFKMKAAAEAWPETAPVGGNVRGVSSVPLLEYEATVTVAACAVPEGMN